MMLEMFKSIDINPFEYVYTALFDRFEQDGITVTAEDRELGKNMKDSETHRIVVLESELTGKADRKGRYAFPDARGQGDFIEQAIRESSNVIQGSFRKALRSED